MKILLFGLASSLHDREYYINKYKIVVDLVNKLTCELNLKIDYIDNPITDYIKLEDYDLYIAVYLTGGTSTLGFRLIMDKMKPVVLIASGEHNALASALSTRSRLVENNIKNYLIPVIDSNDLLEKMSYIIKSIKVINDLKNLRILEINENGFVSRDGLKYIERIGGIIEAMSYSELMNRVNKVDQSVINKLVDELSRRYGINGDNRFINIVKLIHVVENIVFEKNIDVVSIDCFPFIVKTGFTPCLLVSYLTAKGIPVICENDYLSLPLMYIAYRITGYPGWICNPSGYTNNGLTRFAHCTIADNLCLDLKTIEHFESGKPYGLTCRFKYDNVLLTRFSIDYTTLRIYKGKVIESGLLDQNYCRTQLLIEIRGLNPLNFYRNAFGNHHVLIIDENKVIDYLDFISWWMNWKIEIVN